MPQNALTAVCPRWNSVVSDASPSACASLEDGERARVEPEQRRAAQRVAERASSTCSSIQRSSVVGTARSDGAASASATRASADEQQRGHAVQPGRRSRAGTRAEVRRATRACRGRRREPRARPSASHMPRLFQRACRARRCAAAADRPGEDEPRAVEQDRRSARTRARARADQKDVASSRLREHEHGQGGVGRAGAEQRVARSRRRPGARSDAKPEQQRAERRPAGA